MKHLRLTPSLENETDTHTNPKTGLVSNPFAIDDGGVILFAEDEEVGSSLIAADEDSVALEGIGDFIKTKYHDWKQSRVENSSKRLNTVKEIVVWLGDLKKKAEKLSEEIKYSTKGSSNPVDLSSVIGAFADKNGKVQDNLSGSVQSNLSAIAKDLEILYRLSDENYTTVRSIYVGMDLKDDRGFERTFITKINELKNRHWTRYFKPGLENAHNFLGAHHISVDKKACSYDDFVGLKWLDQYNHRDGISRPLSEYRNKPPRVELTRQFTKEEAGKLCDILIRAITDAEKYFGSQYMNQLRNSDSAVDMQIISYYYEGGEKKFGMKYANGLQKYEAEMKKVIQTPAIIQRNYCDSCLDATELFFTATRELYYLVYRISTGF